MSMKRTPLDDWLKAKLGLPPGQELDREALAAYQLRKLQETVALARAESPFHGKRLAALPRGFPQRLEDLASMPFTTVEDLRQHHQGMLCVSQGQVARVVTLTTSGTTAPPKRLYFSDADLELTLDFFAHGMSTLVRPGDKVLILLPGITPDSVGDLLARTLKRMGVQGVVHGPVMDPGKAVQEAASLGADCLVGIPVHVLAMAQHPEGRTLAGMVKSVLLTTDYVPQALARRVQEAWGCEVFEHWGMTETGLGGGVDCAAHDGYHLRAADLFLEIIDPASGQVLPMGQEGELVLTTLTREAMPLLRYRTGDRARLLDGVCACGGHTPRLARVPGRLANRLDLGHGNTLPMGELDEALFALPGLLDYRAGITSLRGKKELGLQVQALPGAEDSLAKLAREALRQIPSLGAGLAKSTLSLGEVEVSTRGWAVNGSTKRTLKGAG